MSNPTSASTAPAATLNIPSISSVSRTASSSKSTQPSNRLYDIPALENDGSNFQLWKYRVELILDLRGLWGIIDGTEALPDKTTLPDEHQEWLGRNKEARAQIALTLKDEPLNGILYTPMAKDAWRKLCERYEGKGKQTIAQLIGELFRNTLTDESPMETQLNAMQQKAFILTSLGQPLDDTLVAVAMVISLPPSYAILRTILMSTSDKLTTEAVFTQVLVEEKQRQANNGQSALVAKGPAPKGKSKRRDKKKSDKKCTYCSMSGHEEKECRKKKAAEEAAKASGSTEKDKTKDKPELSAKVAHLPSHYNTPLQLFVARERSKCATRFDWVVDSGASANMTCQREVFINYRTLTPPEQVVIGDGRSISAVGIGRVEIDVHTGGDEYIRTILQEVYHVPDLNTNLLSVPRLTKQGLEVTFDGSTCKILANGRVAARARKQDSLYILEILPRKTARAYVLQGPSVALNPEASITALTSCMLTSSASLSTWHRRLGHINFDAVSKLLRKDMVNGIKVTGPSTHDKAVCQPCLKGKQHRDTIPKKSDVENPKVLHRTYSDVCGPMETTARTGSRYFVTFIDAHSHHLVVKLVKTKDETFQLTKAYFERAETQTGERPNYFRSDGGGEYGSKEFSSYLESKGIHHEKTNAYTPQENGVAERMNRTLVEMARSMLNDAGLPNTYWGDAILYSAHILNRVPTRATNGDITPHEAFTGNKPSVSHLRVFGCKAHVHIPEEKRQKLGVKSLECVNLGYAEHRRAYVCLDRKTGRIVESRDIVFDEGDPQGPSRVKIDTTPLEKQAVANKPNADEVTNLEEPSEPAILEEYPSDAPESDGPDAESSQESDDDCEQPIPPSEVNPGSKSTSQEVSTTPLTRATHIPSARTHTPTTARPPAPYPRPAPPPEVRRSSRARRAPIRDDDARYSVNAYEKSTLPRQQETPVQPASDAVGEIKDTETHEEVYKATISSDDEPRTFNEAISRPDADLWYAAMTEELKIFEKIGLYEVVERPRDRKIVDSKWVFKIKRGPNGEIERYKARLVAKGFTQVHGIDYTDTFAPVTKFSTIRVLLALAAKHDLEIHQMDVKSAFLNGELEEEIYLHLPPGFCDSSDLVWKLKRALYGLKQAHKSWYKRLCTVFEALGFTRSEADHSVFFKVEDGTIIIVAVYVDDKLILSKDQKVINQLKVRLAAEYDLTDLGEARWILGMEIIRDREKRMIELSQRRYIESILERFEMGSSRPVATPMDPNTKLVKVNEAEVDVKTYQSALGALMYAMLATRPDIAFAVGALSKFAATPGQAHWTALKRVYRYLRGTANMCLTYRGNSETDLLAFVDADWASDINDRRSTTGFVFLISGGAISWSSKKQTSVALSSTEAEYMAAAAATKEAIWLKTFLSELNFSKTHPITLQIDNQSAILLAKNAMFHERTKHIAIRYHFIREKLEEGEICVEYVPTNEQVADVLTKPLTREKHGRFLRGMGVMM